MHSPAISRCKNLRDVVIFPGNSESNSENTAGFLGIWNHCHQKFRVSGDAKKSLSWITQPIPLSESMNMDVKNNGLETFGKQTVWRKSDFWGRDWREHEWPLDQWPHCKNTIIKIWNKYSQKRNCATSVPISTVMCLLALSNLYILTIGQENM